VRPSSSSIGTPTYAPRPGRVDGRQGARARVGADVADRLGQGPGEHAAARHGGARDRRAGGEAERLRVAVERAEQELLAAQLGQPRDVEAEVLAGGLEQGGDAGGQGGGRVRGGVGGGARPALGLGLDLGAQDEQVGARAVLRPRGDAGHHGDERVDGGGGLAQRGDDLGDHAGRGEDGEHGAVVAERLAAPVGGLVAQPGGEGAQDAVPVGVAALVVDPAQPGEGEQRDREGRAGRVGGATAQLAVELAPGAQPRRRVDARSPPSARRPSPRAPARGPWPR
jgi:hypothetical protein